MYYDIIVYKIDYISVIQDIYINKYKFVSKCQDLKESECQETKWMHGLYVNHVRT